MWVSLPTSPGPAYRTPSTPPSRPFSLLTDGLHFAADTRHPDFAAVRPGVRPDNRVSLSLTHSHTPRMSVAVAESSGCFLSALQPNTSRTAYVVPSDGPSPDPMAKARRVQEQVRLRLAEKKKSSSLPRLDDTLVSSTGETINNPTIRLRCARM